MESKIVWEEENEYGILVRVTEKFFKKRNEGERDKCSYSVQVLRRFGDDPEKPSIFPLRLMKGEEADKVVVGVERLLATALLEAQKRFRASLPPREKSFQVEYKPSKEARQRIGTHGKKKEARPE